MMDKDELRKASEALANLFNSFQQAGPVDVDGQAKAYLWAAREYELQDLVQAVTRFIHGDVPGFNGAFCPSTAQLCSEIRERQKMRELKAKNDAKSGKVIPMRPANQWLTKYEADKAKDGERSA